MTDSALRKLAGVAICLGASIAAVISYEHVYHLAVQLGQLRLAAWLMPLSVDGSLRRRVGSAAVGRQARPQIAACRPGHACPRNASNSDSQRPQRRSARHRRHGAGDVAGYRVRRLD